MAHKKAMKRADILESAKTCVIGAREQDYGTPERNFETIANMWNAYISGRPYDSKGLPIPLSAKDVAAMLGCLKLARIASGHAKMDNWIDLAGYAACGGEIESCDDP